MRWLLAMVALVMVTSSVSADVLVLRTQGRVDQTVRAKIDAAIFQLAKSTGEPTTPGDITFDDAAAAVGCKAEEVACKDEVLGMLAVGEVVTITASPKPGGIEVTVRRVAKGGVTRTAVTLVAPDQPDQLAALAPLFEPPAPPPIEPTPAVEPVPQPVGALPPPATIGEPAASVISTPDDPSEPPSDRRRRLHTIGMTTGGALLLVGVIFWGSAASVSGEIDSAPNRTREDLRKLQELEQKGDDYAAVGNVLALTGAIVGGISTYYFVKGNRARRTHAARITPALLGDGAGIAVTFGGTP